MSQFSFLREEFPSIYEAAHRAEALALPDPRGACFYARRALELAVTWIYEHDASVRVPYREDLSALIHEPTFKSLVGQPIFYKCRAIKDLGNQAVHSAKPISEHDSVAAVRELFHVCYWLARTYGRGDKPPAGAAFEPNALPRDSGIPKQTQAQLEQLNEQLAREREKLFAALADKESLDQELQRLRAEVAAAKKANEAVPDAHNYSEAETRDLFIDLLLREAGWPLDKPGDREYEVEGMPNREGKGFVDYVLWGNDGKPLGLVEAKRTKRDSREGQHQAKLYADCLEARFRQRPVIFYTNGYDHWIWDDEMYPPRSVQGFYKKAELELMIQRRQSRKALAGVRVNEKIVERYYQTRAIRRIGEAFGKDHARRALLVMATGAGKTRTVIALADILMRANWVKRVLFLADRTALVNQAVNAFKAHLPESSPVNLVTDREGDGRVFVSTYPTMLGLIHELQGGERRFGVGHFDLIVIDEAHRSIFMKYQAIFEYFDSLLVGLTATPKDEVDRNTYKLFELENGVPTDAYPLNEAVADGYLVPAKSVSVPLKLPSQGITYDLLSDEEKEHFELTDWGERADDVLQARRIEPAAINKWLFNKETVDKVLKHLMERGLKVDGGDKLGKAILFAKNHDHAVFIADRFNKNYPKFKGDFARVVDFKTEYVQDLIDRFSTPPKLPQIAVSVDMLDTGIDVPEVLNLVFFKQVHSKTKFWQMIGRGTRLCPNLLGPGQDKECFFVFDYCGNLEFFKENFDGTEGSSGKSLSQRLFTARLEMLARLATTKEGGNMVREHISLYGSPANLQELFRSIVEILRSEVGAMNIDNFIVRAKRRLVEKYQREDTWLQLDDEKLKELEDDIAGLPSERDPEPVEAKQFDLLILRLQKALLTGSHYQRLKAQVQDIASDLEESSSIPVIKEQLGLIEDLQTDGWWDDVTLPMLELVRLRLRGLIHLVDRKSGRPVYTDFIEEMGEESEVTLPGFTDGISFERFKQKARDFLLQHQDSGAVQKLRLNEPLTSEDLVELERVLEQSGAGSPEMIAKAAQPSLGLFVRSLVGLDREAAKAAFNDFLSDRNLGAAQIEFVSMIIDYLTEHGVVEPRLLYESPFTDISPQGPEGVFSSEMLDQLFDRLALVRTRAAVAI